MFILTFHKNRSKNFQHAMNHAVNLGAEYDGETVTLKIPESDLLYLYPKYLDLISYVQNWKSTRATFRDRPVHPYRFIFQIYHTIRECAQERLNGPDDRHCWQTNDLPGWGCKRIQKLGRYPRGSGEYEKSDRYWYNYGEYDEDGLWIVNQKKIYEVLMKYVQENAIDTCPYFSHEGLWENVQDLPGIIRVDNVNYQQHMIQEYQDGRKVLKPVNIRHMNRIRFEKTPRYKPKLGPQFSRN